MDWLMFLTDEVAPKVGAVITVLATVVMAFATVRLWKLTDVLATETKRLAEATSQPHVVATIEPNRWAMMYADLHIANTGNATAYDVKIDFDPPIKAGLLTSGPSGLIHRVSVLKPSERLVSNFSEFGPILETAFTVTTSWRRDPASPQRESNTYTLDLRHISEIITLGASDPFVQIAEEIKHIREDWQSVAQGSRRTKVDVFTEIDRSQSYRRLLQRRRRLKAAKGKPDGAGASTTGEVSP